MRKEEIQAAAATRDLFKADAIRQRRGKVSQKRKAPSMAAAAAAAAPKSKVNGQSCPGAGVDEFRPRLICRTRTSKAGTPTGS